MADTFRIMGCTSDSPASSFSAAGRPEWIEDLEDLYGAEVSPDTIEMWRERVDQPVQGKDRQGMGGCHRRDRRRLHDLQDGGRMDGARARHRCRNGGGGGRCRTRQDEAARRPPNRMRGTPGPAPAPRADSWGSTPLSALAEIRAAPPGQSASTGGDEDILSAFAGRKGPRPVYRAGGPHLRAHAGRVRRRCHQD